MIGQAIGHNPGVAAYYANLGIVLDHQGRLDKAAAAQRAAIGLAPNFPDALNNLSNTLRKQGSSEAALRCLRHALRLRGERPESHNFLGNALTEAGNPAEAAERLRAALALKPDYAAACANLGDALDEQGRSTLAFPLYRRAVQLAPGDADIRFSHALALLARGEFPLGWAEYEWRWRRRHHEQQIKRDYPVPAWSGEPAAGRTILVWPEQGLGDTIHFTRYVPALVAAGWHVILEVPRALKRISETIPGISVIATGDPAAAFDVHCPLLSLPRFFSADLKTEFPYLQVNPDLAAYWRGRLTGLDGYRVGVVWRGRAAHRRDRNRSTDPALFSRFLDLPGLAVVSLQKEPHAEELAALRPRVPFFDAGPDLSDFAGTAALMAALDLVISVDTSVCHLAGAIAVPTWTLLDFAPDWRWRTDSLWYPTMRLFRQPSPGDWDSVADTLRRELSAGNANRS
jgi:Flp pilus assembly protein TadD